MYVLISLDVEGSEYEILKTIPFDKVDIKVLDVEHKHIGAVFPGTYEEFKDFLIQNGYQYFMKIRDQLGYPNDVVFVKNNFVEEIEASPRTEL